MAAPFPAQVAVPSRGGWPALSVLTSCPPPPACWSSPAQVAVPDNWRETIAKNTAGAPPPTEVDYDALLRRVEAMGEQEFLATDLDKLVEQFKVRPGARCNT